jgi:uncharacterized protein
VMAVLFIVTHREGRVRWKRALAIIVGSFIGTPLGYWFLVQTGDRAVFRIVLGAFLTAAGACGVLTPALRRPAPRVLALPIGVLSGFIGGAFATGGPPIVLYLYSLTDDARDMKATVQFIFLVNLAYRLVVTFGFGRGCPPDVLTEALVAIPLCVPAMLLGHWLSRAGSAERFRIGVNAIIISLGVVIAVKALTTS